MGVSTTAWGMIVGVQVGTRVWRGVTVTVGGSKAGLIVAGGKGFKKLFGFKKMMTK
jgi:hypothetical protein